MAVDDVVETLKDKSSSRSDKYIAIYIAVLAVLLSIASVAGGNAAKDASKANLDASNLWAFFQAKNLRRTDYQIAAERISVTLASEPPPSPDARALLETQLSEYRARVARYESEPDKREGLKELIVRAREQEAIRDLALKRDPYFDYAQALLQIAIVLASVAIIAGGSLSIVGSLLVAALGVASLVNGYTLFVDIEPILAEWLQSMTNAMVQNAKPSTS